MKLNWVRGIVALAAVAVGVVLGYSMDISPTKEDDIPASLEARYRFNQAVMEVKERLHKIVTGEA